MLIFGLEGTNVKFMRKAAIKLRISIKVLAESPRLSILCNCESNAGDSAI